MTYSAKSTGPWKHTPTSPPTPSAWLLLFRCQDEWLVQGVFDALDHPELLRELAGASEYGNEMEVVRDDPSLAVLHRGLSSHSPEWLTARDIWFARYQARLSPYLVAPQVAHVFTFSHCQLLDPLCTFKAAAGGPCPLPADQEWPVCGYCNSQMVMVGVLDFRQFTAVNVPRGSLVLHGCPECSLCADRETWSVCWLREGVPLTIHGDINQEVSLGTRWLVTEYPTPTMDALDRLFPRTRASVGERATYLNFACSADKVGGHANWIQGDEDFKRDYPTGDYVFIGQMTGDDESLCRWDSPVVYLMYSPTTGETIASLQSF